MENIGLAQKGYNLLTGNPYTTNPGIDPGFTNRGGGAIFKFEYSQGLETADGRWEMPDHTQVERNIGCSLAMSNTVTHSESEESNEMAVSVSVEAEASAWGFETRATRATARHGRK